MNFWGRETALPCPEGAVLSMVASDWIIRAGDRAIGKCAQRANSSCNSVNFTRYPKLGHGRNSDTAVPFPYELGRGYLRLCAKKFGHGSAVSLRIGPWLSAIVREEIRTRQCRFPTNWVVVMCSVRAIDDFGVGKRHCRVLFCLHQAIDDFGVGKRHGAVSSFASIRRSMILG
jgi:hypothetical protein